MPDLDPGSAEELRPKLGVLRLEDWGKDYFSLTGDVDAEKSWAYPIIHEVVKNVTFELLCDPDAFMKSTKMVFEGVTGAVQALIQQGANSIISNCGLFMWLHATGIIEAAVDQAVDNLRYAFRRPTVMLSSLNMLPAYLPTLGLGKQQRDSVGRKLNPLPLQCRVVVFTSNGDSCKQLFKTVPQLLEYTTITHPSAALGEVLVVGLDGDNVIGLGDDGLGGPLPGFEAVKDGTPVVYSKVQPGVEKVAMAIKKKYPSIALAVVECTQVSSFSDTIRRVMNVDVLDPIKLGTSALELSADHAFAQDGPSDRLKQVKHHIKLMLGRCEKLDEAAKVLEDEVALQTGLEEKERGAFKKLEDKIAKEVATLKEKNKEEWDPSLPLLADQLKKKRKVDTARGHRQNFAKMRAQHEKDFAVMREMQQKNKLRQAQIDLLIRKQQAQ